MKWWLTGTCIVTCTNECRCRAELQVVTRDPARLNTTTWRARASPWNQSTTELVRAFKSLDVLLDGVQIVHILTSAFAGHGTRLL